MPTRQWKIYIEVQEDRPWELIRHSIASSQIWKTTIKVCCELRNLMHTPLPARSEAPHAARYEALLRVLHLLTAQRNPTALFRVLASELRHVVTCDGGISLALYDAEVRKLYFDA